MIPATPLHTARLLIDELSEDDAEFTLALLNDPDYIANIADRGVRSLAQARQFLLDGPLASYRRHGFGMFAVRARDTGETLGMCGLLRRDQLDGVDIGYAFLPVGRGRGYALESASRVMQFARDDLGLRRVLGIVARDNAASRALLKKLGLRYERMIRLNPEDAEICLYGWSA